MLEEQRNESGNSLVWLASRAGSTEMVKYLVNERGLDVAEPGWDMGGRCVDDGCYSEHGWKSWEYDVIGDSSPFFIAAQYGNTSTAAALVELGASPLTVRNDGSSPCLMATKVGNVSTLSALLELGACPQTARNDGQTPFFFAAKRYVSSPPPPSCHRRPRPTPAHPAPSAQWFPRHGSCPARRLGRHRRWRRSG